MHLLTFPQDLGNQCVEKGCDKGWTEAARTHVVFKSGLLRRQDCNVMTCYETREVCKGF